MLNTIKTLAPISWKALIILLSLSSTVRAQQWLTTSPDILYADPISARVGIGTSSPGAFLHIKDDDCFSEEKIKYCPLLFRADYMYKQDKMSADCPISSANAFEVFGNTCDGNPPVETFKITSWGDVVCGNNWLRVVDGTGFVGVGTASPAYELDVAGVIRCHEVRVCLSGCDFVFENNYPLQSLNEVEKFTQENKRLPHFASAQEMELSDGVSVGQMNSKLLQSVEEIYLHLFEMNNKMQEMNNKIKELSQENAVLKMQVGKN